MSRIQRNERPVSPSLKNLIGFDRYPNTPDQHTSNSGSSIRISYSNSSSSKSSKSSSRSNSYSV